MKNIFFGLILVTLASCGGKGRVAEWRTPQEMPPNISYEKVWEAIVNTALENYEIDVIEPQAGYFQSKWKTGSMIWQQFPVGISPYKKTRLSVRVLDKNPVKYNVKVETYTAESLSQNVYFTKMRPSGNDSYQELQFIRRINDKLREAENATN
ncbi:MAG: hypothetical protein HY884_05360 [Deltaproteobacteria bacterium]|nr:hypothetical protein [Deltaproteobacteria bacterium]